MGGWLREHPMSCEVLDAFHVQRGWWEQLGATMEQLLTASLHEFWTLIESGELISALMHSSGDAVFCSDQEPALLGVVWDCQP